MEEEERFSFFFLFRHGFYLQDPYQECSKFNGLSYKIRLDYRNG